VRDVRLDDLDEAGVIHLPPEYLEVLQAWDPRDLPRHLNDVSDEDAAAYVERHFMLLGVPAARVAVAARRLSPSDLDVAELRPADRAPKRKSSRGTGASRKQQGRATSRPTDGSNVVPLHGERR
jgi:type IV secretion system protein VirD4